jgi:hypothetical protein
LAMEKVSSVAVSETCDAFSFRLNFSIIMFSQIKAGHEFSIMLEAGLSGGVLRWNL